MTTKTKALKLALEALIGARAFLESDAPVEIWSLNDKAITVIKKALAQPEQELVAWMYPDALCDKSCLYLCTKGFTQFPECANTTPQRTWVGLTDEDKQTAFDDTQEGGGFWQFADAIEAKLKAKNERKEKNT